MFTPLPDRFLPHAQTVLRVAAGLGFFTHGAQKLFGWFGATGTVSLTSIYGAAGVIETVAGLMIAAGLLTRLVAFVAAGEMAVAYFWVHAANGGMFWWSNQGELAMLYSVIFLAFAAWGAGPFSLDTVISGRATARSADR